MNMDIWSSARRLTWIISGAGRFGRSLHIRRHMMRFGDLDELEVGGNGALVSTGYSPCVELLSDQAEPPRCWCWLHLEALGESSSVPRILVHTPASSKPECFILAPPASEVEGFLLRLPEHTTSIQLLPTNCPGQTNLRALRVTEVGKLRLFLRLIWIRPRTALRNYRTASSFTHFKSKLIEDAQMRSRHGRALDWLQVYRSGVHPSAIPCNGDSSFTIVASGANLEADRLREWVASVFAQTYTRWRLIVSGIDEAEMQAVLGEDIMSSSKITCVDAVGIKTLSAVRGGKLDEICYLLFLIADDILEPHALARFADAAARENADMLYGDRVLVERHGNRYVSLQAFPAFSYSEYLGSPARIHPVALRANLVIQAGKEHQLADQTGLDTILYALERNLRVTHIPDVLSYTRLPQQDLSLRTGAEARPALETAHLRRMGYLEAQVSCKNSTGALSVRRSRRPRGRVLAVVPTKNQYALLMTCINTVRATTQNLSVDIAVVDHQSTDLQTLAYLKRLVEQRVQVLPYRGAFNYSAMNNRAVTHFGGNYDFYLFLNNDIEAIDSGWLEAMLDLAAQPGVGVVGATLLYSDHRIQHAGVIVGQVGVAHHIYRLARLEDYQDLPSGPHITRECSAVTGACMLVKSAVFHKADGFDEGLEIGYNDIDLCLRIRKMGLHVLNCAEAILIHHESASRGTSEYGRDPHPDDTRRFIERHTHLLQDGDPFFSPLLDEHDPFFTPKPNALREQHIGPRSVVHVAARYKAGNL